MKKRAFAVVRRTWAARRRVFTAARWLVGTALGVWTVRQAILVGREETDKAFAVLHSLYAFAGLLTTVLLVVPEVAGWVLAPVDRLIEAVLLPGDSEPPPVNYTLARMYHHQRRYEEACEEYFKIIRYHPRELSAYLEGMDTAGAARQPEVAAKFFRLGKRVFRREETLRKLQDALEQSCHFALLMDASAGMEGIDAAEAAGDPPREASEVSPPAIPTERPDP